MRTATTLLYCDSTRSVFGVLRGPMRGRYFDSNRADIIAQYEYPAGTRPQNADALEVLYRKLTARHATKEAPPVHWQA